MDYKKKYEELVGKIEKAYLFAQTDSTKAVLEEIRPILKEIEDERIKNVIYGWIYIQPSQFFDNGFSKEEMLAWLEKQGEQKPTLPKWRYKKDNTPLLRDSLILNKYGCVVKSPSGALVSDVWVIDYDELAKLPKEEFEKQGEQPQGKTALEAAKEEKVDNQNCAKPADKVEPKFHEGEWLTENHPNSYARFVQILEIVNVQGKNRYRISRDLHNDEDIVECRFVEDNWHSFNIKNTKPGDVLAFYSEYRGNKMVQVGIIEKYVGKHGGCSNTFKIYVGVNWDNNLQIGEYMGCSDIRPATKEQRDTLEKAMVDAGHTFDFEKKELKKIKQKPAWSEEDEKNLQGILDEIEANKSEAPEYDIDTYNRFIDWLKSIKDRVGCEANCTTTWKPSEEQMIALNFVVNLMASSESPTHNDYYYNVFKNLRKQLKKLREE